MRTETITRLRPATTTDPSSGELVPDWSQPPTQCRIQTIAPAEPRPATGHTERARYLLGAGWNVYLPYDTDIAAYDRVILREQLYDVASKPAEWLGAGIVVALNGRPTWTGLVHVETLTGRTSFGPAYAVTVQVPCLAVDAESLAAGPNSDEVTSGAVIYVPLEAMERFTPESRVTLASGRVVTVVSVSDEGGAPVTGYVEVRLR